MTVFLPQLLWKRSPNCSARNARVDLLVLHDCEGGYEPSIAWFLNERSNVSAHYVVRDDGQQATQMVELADKAWHACAFNSRSVGVEMAGYASKGYCEALLLATARIFAYLAHHLQIPVRHARGGVGPGIESHWGLGRAGGHHFDPSSDPTFMEKFVAMVSAETAKGDLPAVWEPEQEARACSLTPNAAGSKPINVRTIEGLQEALKRLGYNIAIDGDYGPETRQAVASFQMHAGVVADGVCGPQNEAALLKELKGG